MDIRCPICGEPWDLDCIHEEVEVQNPGKPWKKDGKYDQKLYDPYFNSILADFRKRGCEVFHCKHNKVENKDAATLSVALMDILGDDVDGIANELEDAETLGYI